MICYLMRHGKDDETLRGGWSDAPLTDLGMEQAKAAAEEIVRKQGRIGRILSSDLPRAVQTAECVAQKLGLPVELRPEFREVNNGVLAGMKNDLARSGIPACSGISWIGRSATPMERVRRRSVNGSLPAGNSSELRSVLPGKMFFWSPTAA